MEPAVLYVNLRYLAKQTRCGKSSPMNTVARLQVCHDWSKSPDGSTRLHDQVHPGRNTSGSNHHLDLPPFLLGQVWHFLRSANGTHNETL